MSKAFAGTSFPPTSTGFMTKLVAMMVLLSFFLSLFASHIAGELSEHNFHFDSPLPDGTLCSLVVQPFGYPCSEHTIQTNDGFLLGLQRVSSPAANLRKQLGPPVLLLHGLFMAGDAWFLNPPEESLGFILADHGFDVWVGNVRGTHWSHGHKSLSVKDKDFWDWSWQELALCDLREMISFISSTMMSKVSVVGHSQGTIISLAALTQSDIAEMVEAAALLSPISFLGHISSQFVLRMVSMHLDEMILAMGIHQLNFRSKWGVNLMDSVCAGHLNCSDLLTSITGKNCCFNDSLVDYYLGFEPHPSSVKNVHHLFQMIRTDTFAQYDYGIIKNLLLYGKTKPPEFNLGDIPKSLPLWMAYGGNDALADLTDVQDLLKKLQSTPELVYLENYGHLDFIVSVNAKNDLYDNMISFLNSRGKSSTLK
ncbi:hypothetical protein UlMin_031059 [Ulmus minor]